MKNYISDEEVKLKIEELEQKQARELEALKAQLRTTYDGIQPLNLIKSTLSDIVKTPDIQDSLLNTGIGLTAGYLAKKMAFGKSNTITKTVLGDLFQVGVANLVAKHPDKIKAGLHALVDMAIHQFQKTNEGNENVVKRRRLMKEIMELTNFIQTAHPQLYIVLEETPLPIPEGDKSISIESLKSYRDSLKLQLVQFGEKQLKN